MEKKYNIVLGLMIFFFIIIVGVALAWGLGYIGVKSNENSTTNDKTEAIVDNDLNKAENSSSTETPKDQEKPTVNISDDLKGSTNADSSNANNQPILDVTNLDGAKCLNAKGMSYEYSTAKHNQGVYVNIKDNKLFFGVNNNELGEANIKIEKY